MRIQFCPLAMALLSVCMMAGCTSTPEPPISPLPMPDTLLEVQHVASYAIADWSTTFHIPASTHTHQIELVKEVREVGTGRVLLNSRIVTGILSKSAEPEPAEEVAASWVYDADVLERLGVDEAEEWIKPVMVCVRAEGETEPCLCRLTEDGELEECNELLGRCTGIEPNPQQGTDGFCFTGLLSELSGLNRYWFPLMMFEVRTD